MSVETKRREILQMLEKGSITAEKAGELLTQLNTEKVQMPEEEAIAPRVSAAAGPSEIRQDKKPPRWLHVRVSDMTGRSKVNVNIPLSLAKIGLRIGAKFAPEMEGLEWDEVLSQISGSGEQTIVEVQDEEDGELVQVFVS